jgi:hypothetical protein
MRSATAPKPPSFASLVQQFFTEYLVAQRAVSPRTVACYRDALLARILPSAWAPTPGSARPESRDDDAVTSGSRARC